MKKRILFFFVVLLLTSSTQIFAQLLLKLRTWFLLLIILGISGSQMISANTSTTIGGVNLGNLPDYLLFFSDANIRGNWQGATKGFVGDVAVNGILADETTSGSVPYAGTIYTNDSTLGDWQDIVNQNAPPNVIPAQAFGSYNNVALINSLQTQLNNVFTQINALPASPGYSSVLSTSLNGLNTQNGIPETFVINVTSGFTISSIINITGDAGDIYILRWDTDANFGNGYDGQVKFQSGGAIVPLGGLKPTNFLHVAGNLGSSGGGSNPPLPYPQGPRYNDGQGSLITGGQDFNGGGFFTGYWFTTGSPADGKTSSLSNGIFVGGWYSTTTEFSMTSGTSGVYVSPPCTDAIAPQFVPPSPTCNDIITGDTGVAITFTVQAQDNSAGPITLDVDSLPPGATMTPPLPTTGNPVSSVFNWTPPSYNGQSVTFTATDSCGNQTSCQIIFDVLLPVELTSFTSLINNNEVTLNWSTATESNNSRFEIERANGNWQEWNKVGTIQGNGNSTQPISYSFVDRGLNVGSYNYRLKQIDFNGNFTYHNLSNEVIIGVPTRFNLSQNYPNPFNPSTKIDFEIPKDGNVNLYVYDNSGKQVSTVVSGFRTAGYYTVQFNASNLASGIYYYKIQYSGVQSFEKVMKMALVK